jgi:hypothetical protein
MKDDVPPDPMNVRLFRPPAVMTNPNRVPDPIQQLWLGASMRAGGILSWLIGHDIYLFPEACQEIK